MADRRYIQQILYQNQPTQNNSTNQTDLDGGLNSARTIHVRNTVETSLPQICPPINIDSLRVRSNNN